MSTGLRSQLAPKGLQFNASDFFISDKYATILTVVSYPKYISPGYLSSLTNMSGIKVVVKHIPIEFETMRKMINKHYQKIIQEMEMIHQVMMQKKKLYYFHYKVWEK